MNPKRRRRRGWKNMASFVSTHCILPSGVGFVHDQDRSCGRTNTLHLQNAPKSPSSLSFLLSVRGYIPIPFLSSTVLLIEN